MDSSLNFYSHLRISYEFPRPVLWVILADRPKVGIINFYLRCDKIHNTLSGAHQLVVGRLSVLIVRIHLKSNQSLEEFNWIWLTNQNGLLLLPSFHPHHPEQPRIIGHYLLIDSPQQREGWVTETIEKNDYKYCLVANCQQLGSTRDKGILLK